MSQHCKNTEVLSRCLVDVNKEKEENAMLQHQMKEEEGPENYDTKEVKDGDDEVQLYSDTKIACEPPRVENLAEVEMGSDDEDFDEEDEEELDSDDEEESDNDDDSPTMEKHYGQWARYRQQKILNNPTDDFYESSTDSDYSDDEDEDIENNINTDDLSDESGCEWKPISSRPIAWVQRQMHAGANPRELLSQIISPSSSQSHVVHNLNDMTLWRILAGMFSEPPRRPKLSHVNTFEDVLQLVRASKKIIVLTGAGVSVSCGIPDFRSSNGIYARLAQEYPDLPDPQAMFDINYFARDPRPFFKFAREIYPGQFKPSPCHRFIKMLEEKQKLLRNYTQNIDTLEQIAGIKNVIECHGSFSTASCTKCRYKCNADAIRDDIFAQRIPVCPRCQPNVQRSVDASEPVSGGDLPQLVANGIMKPDIVFFGEGLPEEFHTVMAEDKDKCDLLIVMGSSLKVRPVALIPNSIPPNVPQVLINREQLHHLEFDVELLGDSDVIINQLCHRLGGDWENMICFNDVLLQESAELLPLEKLLNNAVGGSSTNGSGTAVVSSDEDAQQQLQDIDTQSVKSSGSTETMLRSVGVYSDSGFESSTSSGVGCGNGGGALNKIVANRIDTGGVDFEISREFRPFGTAALARQKMQKERNLSIDSPKDSGIQSDSGPSSISVGALLPPLAVQPSDIKTTMPQCKNLMNHEPNAEIDADHELMMQEQKKKQQQQQRQSQHQQQKSQSIADRLIDGTYFYTPGSFAYIFPGAQVSWCADGDEDDLDHGGIVGDGRTNGCEEETMMNFEDQSNDNNGEHLSKNFSSGAADDDTNAAPLSPLLPPSVEAEIVNEMKTNSDKIASTSNSKSSTKRRSSEENTVTITSAKPAASFENAINMEIKSNNNKTYWHIYCDEKNSTVATTGPATSTPPPNKRARQLYRSHTEQQTENDQQLEAKMTSISGATSTKSTSSITINANHVTSLHN